MSEMNIRGSNDLLSSDPTRNPCLCLCGSALGPLSSCPSCHQIFCQTCILEMKRCRACDTNVAKWDVEHNFNQVVERIAIRCHRRDCRRGERYLGPERQA